MVQKEVLEGKYAVGELRVVPPLIPGSEKQWILSPGGKSTMERLNSTHFVEMQRLLQLSFFLALIFVCRSLQGWIRFVAAVMNAV